MINSVFFIQNGGCIFVNKLFHRPSQMNEMDDNIISGFLTAISQFAETALGDKLEIILLQNQKIFFKFFDMFFIVILTDLEDDLTSIKNVLDDLAKNFIGKYDLSKFNGNSDFCSDFLPIIDKIIGENKLIKEKLTDELIDILKSDVKKLSSILKKGEFW